jgi:hypothetical protein
MPPAPPSWLCPKALQQTGGWSSPAIVMPYVNEAKIANEGIKL